MWLLWILALGLLFLWSKLRLLVGSLAVLGLIVVGAVLSYLFLRVLRHQMQWLTSLLFTRMIQNARRVERT